MVNKKEIAYCGLVCSFCDPSKKCSCKGENHCGKRLSPQGCYQYNCCVEKGIEGCWECGDAPCGIDMMAKDKVKIRAFIRFIKRYGMDAFCEALEKCELSGCIYHRDGIFGDYDLASEEEVIALLKNK